MELFSFLDRRRAPREAPDIPVVARAHGDAGSWTAHIAAGDAIVANLNEYGMQFSSAVAYREGTPLKLSVLGRTFGQTPLEVRAVVVWCKRNEIAQPGRHACGVVFKPDTQPVIRELLSRFPVPARAAEA